MKNFILKQSTKYKTIEKVGHFTRYLVNKKHPSHHNSEIYNISEDIFSNYKNMVFELENYQKNKVNGGRPPKASTHYTLSFPEDLGHPSPEEWEKIYNETICNFCEYINKNQERKQNKGVAHIKAENRADIERYNAIRLDPETFKKNSVCVLHNEEKAFEKGSRIHILTSNVQNGEYLKMLNQTAGQNFIKKAYDEAILKVLGHKPEDYIPKCDRVTKEEKQRLDAEDKAQFEARDPKNKGKRRRRRRPAKPPYVAKQEKIQNATETVKNNDKKVRLKAKKVLDAQKDLMDDKNEFLTFQEDFGDYLEAIVENDEKDNKYSVKEKNGQYNFFDFELDALEFSKLEYNEFDDKKAMKRVEKPYFEEMKEYLSNKFEAVFGSTEIFDKMLDTYNKMISKVTENDNFKLKSRKNKHGPK